MKKGFSLIELLVVMVIIGILAGIGIAQFKGQQAKAKLARRAAECSQAERCSLLRKTCIDGGDTNCASICTLEGLSCQVSFLGSGPDEIVNVDPVNATISNGFFKAKRGSLPVYSTAPVFLANQDGSVEFTLHKEVNGLLIGFVQSPAYRGITWGANLDGVFNNSYSFNKWAYQGPFQYEVGDVFSLSRENQRLIFRVNGEVIQHNQATSTIPLFLSINVRFGNTEFSDFKVKTYSD